MSSSIWYVAQAIPQIDVEIAEKGHFWMETNKKLELDQDIRKSRIHRLSSLPDIEDPMDLPGEEGCCFVWPAKAVGAQSYERS